MENNKTETENKTPLEYKENPTKSDLLAYFGKRIRIRKMVPREAFRLQDCSDEDIDKIQAYPFKTLEQRAEAIKNADKKELNRIKKESIAKTRQYALAGNSICVSCLYHLFRTLFLHNQPENTKPILSIKQPSLFDDL